MIILLHLLVIFLNPSYEDHLLIETAGEETSLGDSVKEEGTAIPKAGEDYKDGFSKKVEINLGKDWKGLKVPVQMPEALSSKALFKVRPSDGLILDLAKPSKTQWEKAQIEWKGQTVPLKINVGVFTFRLNPRLGIFLGAKTGAGALKPKSTTGRNDYQDLPAHETPPKPWNLERDCKNYDSEPNKELFKWCVDEMRAEYWRKVEKEKKEKKENDYQDPWTFTL